MFKKQAYGPVKLMVQNATLSDVMGDIARVDLSHRPFAKAGHVIIIRCGNKKIRAVARGTAKNSKGILVLEQRLREKLGVKVNQEFELIFEKACLIDEIIWSWSASDVTVRAAARISVISLLLGSFGVLL